MMGSDLDFQKIHDVYRPKIQRYLAHLVGEFEAEDLTQEVFIRIHRSLPAFRGESQLSTWIYRIASNAACDRLRSPSYRRLVQDGAPALSDLEAAESVDIDVWSGEEAASPEQQIHHTEMLRCYCDFVKNLPESYRLVVALSELEELTAKEISDILGLSPEVVKIRLHRGRMKLLQQLKAHCKAEDWL
jgi:RNA polymerase sigma-70 factor (ECF subfamily)